MRIPDDVMEHTLRITTTDGEEYVGSGWRYDQYYSFDAYGREEETLDMLSDKGAVVLFGNDIVSIEYLD